MVLAFARDVTEHYWRKYYKRKEGAPDAGPVVHGFSIFSLTWQRRADDFVLIRHDQKATVATKGFIKNFMGKTVRRIYGNRKDLFDDFERCYEEKALIQRKTLYRMFTTGEERLVVFTYVFVPPDIVVTHIEDHTDEDADETFNQSMVRSASVGVCVVQDGRRRFVNPRFLDYTGCVKSEPIGKSPTDSIHPGDKCLLREILHEPNREILPQEAYTRSGSRKRWGSGGPWLRQAVLLNFLDHTELEQASEKVDELASLRSSIMEAISHAVIGLDNRRIVFANNAVQSVFDCKPEALIGRSMRVLFHNKREYEDEGEKFYSSLKNQRTCSLEFTYRHRNGNDVNCRTSVSRIGSDDTDKRIVATYTDIPEKKHAEEHFRENQRSHSPRS